MSTITRNTRWFSRICSSSLFSLAVSRLLLGVIFRTSVHPG